MIIFFMDISTETKSQNAMRIVLHFLFYFLLPISRESIVFGSNFRSGDFDGFTRFEVP